MTDMPTTDDDGAEQLDETKLGDSEASDAAPGMADYPPEQPLGVEDPMLLDDGEVGEDDLAVRAWRHGDTAGGTTSDGPEPDTQRTS